MARHRIRRTQISLWLEDDQLERLRAVKAGRRVSVQAILRRAIDCYLDTESRSYLPAEMRTPRAVNLVLRDGVLVGTAGRRRFTQLQIATTARAVGIPVGSLESADTPPDAVRPPAKDADGHAGPPRTVEDLLMLARGLGRL